MILKFKDEAIYIKPNGEYVICSPSQKEDEWTTTPQLDYYNNNCRGMYCQAHITEVEQNNNNILFSTLQSNETEEVERGEKRVYLPINRIEDYYELITDAGINGIIFVSEKSDGTIYTLGSQRNNNKVGNLIDEYRYNSETENIDAIVATEAISNHDDIFPNDSIPNETVPFDFKYDEEDDELFFKNRITENFLYSPGNGNYLRETSLQDIENTDMFNWRIDVSEIENQFIIYTVDDEIEQRFLKFNKNNTPPLFSCYREDPENMSNVRLFYDVAAQNPSQPYYCNLTDISGQTYSGSINIECYVRNTENYSIFYTIRNEDDETVKDGIFYNEENLIIDLNNNIPNGEYYIILYFGENENAQYFYESDWFTIEGHTPPEPPTPTPTDEAIFILPFKDSAQGELDEATYHDDVQIFNQIDLGLISYNELQERYSSNNFFDNELWSFICDNNLVDETATNKVINSLYAKYSTKNEQVYIKDLTIDELKNFRTWLATTLYNDYNEENARLEELNTEETNMMLKYYANNMYDDVIKALTKLGQNSAIMKDFLKAYGVFSPNTVISNIGGTGIDIMTKSTGTMMNMATGKTVMALPGSTSKCGCSGSLNMYDMGLSACDCVEIYRKNVYTQMVADFSNIDFWIKRPDILPDFKKYIEGIINNNFTLGYSEHSTLYCDCSCNSTDNQQAVNMTILRNLLRALQYIYNEVEEDAEGESLSGHKNFVSESLNKWAVILYEKMQWI